MKVRNGVSKAPTQLIIENIRTFGKNSLETKRKKRVLHKKKKSKPGKFRSNIKRKRTNKKIRK